jgi:hypothetical protein
VLLVVVAPAFFPVVLYPVEHVQLEAELVLAVEELLGHDEQLGLAVVPLERLK